MLQLSFFDYQNNFVENANVIEVNKKDIIYFLDNHVATVETCGGWYEIYNSCGKLVAYWEADKSIDCT